MRVDALAAALACEWEGDGSRDIRGIASLLMAGEDDLSFLTDRRLQAQAAESKAAALIVGGDFPALGTSLGSGGVRAVALLRASRPMLAVGRAIALLRPPWQPEPGVHPSASIDASARLGARCHVGAFAVIGAGCRIGDDAVIHPHAVFYPGVIAGARLLAHAHAVVREGTTLGDDVILQPGVVIGGDGFGFTVGDDRRQVKIPQVGAVSIGSRVEIQANSCVDRASLEVTRIGDGAKVDNLTQIGHNCDIGEDVLLCAQVGLAGSTRIEAGAILAGQVGVAGHCTIGEGAIITAQSGTHGDLAPGGMYSGSPAFDHAQWLRATAGFARLGEMQRELRALRQAIAQLEKTLKP
ncbi:MAG: UDP-3-O-(3-hydroxymyristoyl)glucosamine N-acyltransferase [Terriglobales bacterium]